MQETKWIPEIPRPNLYNNRPFFADILKEWVKKEYAEEFEMYGDCDITEFSMYQHILENYNGDDEDTAELLIRYENWTYQQAKEFEDKCLSLAVDEHQDKLSMQWIIDNKYQPPFPVGSKVKYHNHEGIIMPDDYQRYIPYGKICVLTDDQAEKNRKNKLEGNSEQYGGYVCEWEDLELISLPE